MTRRGFLSSIRDALRPRNDLDPFFFGIQCVINVFGEDDLRRQLHAIIAEAPEREAPVEKWTYYKRISALLRENVPAIEYGYWDYLVDPDDAVAEFDDWISEIEASTATVDEELGDEIAEWHRISNDKDYVVISLIFLLSHAREHARLEQTIESIAEDQAYTPWAFQTLIDAVPRIDFGLSQGDAVFILPGSDEDGFSWTDMRAPGWDYLKPVIGTID